MAFLRKHRPSRVRVSWSTSKRRQTLTKLARSRRRGCWPWTGMDGAIGTMSAMGESPPISNVARRASVAEEEEDSDGSWPLTPALSRPGEGEDTPLTPALSRREGSPLNPALSRREREKAHSSPRPSPAGRGSRQRNALDQVLCQSRPLWRQVHARPLAGHHGFVCRQTAGGVMWHASSASLVAASREAAMRSRALLSDISGWVGKGSTCLPTAAMDQAPLASSRRRRSARNCLSSDWYGISRLFAKTFS